MACKQSSQIIPEVIDESQSKVVLSFEYQKILAIIPGLIQFYRGFWVGLYSGGGGGGAYKQNKKIYFETNW